MSALLSLVLGITLMSSCDEDINEQFIKAEISSDADHQIIFSADGTETKKTFKFNSSKRWQLEAVDADWFTISPVKGEAGETELTIELTNPSETKVRQNELKIYSGNIEEDVHMSITVVQQKVPVKSIELAGPPDNRLAYRHTAEMTYKVTPYNATLEGAKWSSSDETILTVDSLGKIKGVGFGTSTITVSIDGITAKCDIEVYPTDDIVTFRKLSQTEGSGVTFENGAYVVGSPLLIDETKTLYLEDNEVIKLKDKVEIKIEGLVEFTPKTGVTFQAYDEVSHPKQLSINGDEAGGTIKNVTFIDVPLKLVVGIPIVIDGCEFKYVRSRKNAIDIGTSKSVQVTNCRFIENDYPAVGTGANITAPLLFKNNYLYKNSKNARNRPQINVTVAGDGLVEIIENEVVGPAENTTCGGIAVNNLLGLSGTNKVVISGNKVRDNRYGIATIGLMDVVISKNELIDNMYEADPSIGGEGISITASGKAEPKAKIFENTLKGNLWGIVVNGNFSNGSGPNVSIGDLTEGPNYNIGKNVLDNRGHDGMHHELYNNSPKDMMAVNNTWGSFEQTEENIEKVIFHKTDDPKLGKVTYMPPYKP